MQAQPISKKPLVVIAVLVISNLITGFLWYRSDHSLAEHAERHELEFPLVDVSRSFIDQKDFIVNIQPLREKLRELAGTLPPESVSIYLEYLNTGANISINPDVYIWPASLVKLPVAIIAMKKVERGDWKLSNELVLFPEDRNYDSGSEESLLAKNPDGTRFTIENLIRESLINSDNTAHKMLSRNLHDDEVLEFSYSLGLEGLSNKEGKFSAKEYSRVFRALYTASFLNRENSQKILGWLAESTFDKFLSTPIPKGVPFANKYGMYIQENVYSDAGIVYLENRPYLLAVMMQGDKDADSGAGEEDAAEFMHEVSKEAYEYFSAYGNQ